MLECSGKPAAYQQAFDALRTGGTLVSIGEGAHIEVKPSEILIGKHLNWPGSLYSTMEQGKQVQRLMLQNEFGPTCFVAHRFSLDQLSQAFGQVVGCTDGILKSIMLGT